MPVVVFLGSFFLYAVLPSRNFNYADDSLAWAFKITKSEGLINSHHLYLNVVRKIYHLFENAGIEIQPTTLLELYSAFWAALGLAFLYLLLVRAGFGNAALLGVMICGFSAGYWSYAIVGDVYAPSIGLLIIGLYFLYSALNSDQRKYRISQLSAAVLAFALMLAHHQALFIFVAGIAPAALLFRKAAFKTRVLVGAGIPFGVSLIALEMYRRAYSLLPSDTKSGFIRFCAGYVADFEGRPDQRKLTIGSLLNAGAGETRALISTNVLFKNPEFAHAIQSRYPSRAVYPYPYLVHGMPAWLAILTGVLAAIALLAALYLTTRGLLAGVPERDLVLLVLVPQIPQMLFFMWWEGITDEFCLWTLPLIAIFITRGAREMERPLIWLGVLCVCLSLSTIAGSVSRYWNPRNDIDLVNDEYVNSLGAHDLLIGFEEIQSRHRISLAARRLGFTYFDIRNQAPQWSTIAESKLNEVLESAIKRGDNIYVSPRLTYPPESGLADLRHLNPKFEAKRHDLLAELRAIPRVKWMEPVVFLEDYFHLDPGQLRPK